MNESPLCSMLAAFVSRLTPKHLATIVEAEREAAHASLNLSTAAQFTAHHKLVSACHKAVEGMTEHDRQLLADLIVECGKVIEANADAEQKLRGKP